MHETRANLSASAPMCRHCGRPLTLMLADLGVSPVANDYVDLEHYAQAEPMYPLEVYVCGGCRLAQTRDVMKAETLFRADYAYFSSHSSTWLAHARAYVTAMIERFHLAAGATHVEIAANDGYLLQYSKAAGLACLGVEPCASVAAAAREKGLEVREAFFGADLAEDLARAGWKADLVTANNVLAHVPDINDFVNGARVLLKPEGVATFEVQHLLTLMRQRQFDTIYHEHFSYLSLIAAERIFAAAGLRLFDVELLETHGGSIRFFVCRPEAAHETTERVAAVRAEELAYGLDDDAIYLAWNEDVKRVKRAFLALLIDLKAKGAHIAAYGAPAKGVTLLNFCGVRRDMLDFTVDRAPSKQGRFMPGVRVPILAPEAIDEMKPDYLVILPWNLKDEIKAQMAHIRGWGCKFITPVPEAVIEE